ncbi:MAG TPA: DNA internalization-related competence protein ComEC/Rec2 [Methylophilaceae bacterium]|nr:DNA internalization-related competence protein ComEC/Rec2 [Methylophilaceae bacterium]
MIPSALVFVLGVWVLQQQSALPSPFWLLSAIPLIGFAVASRYRYPAITPHLLAALCFLAGFFWAAMLAQARLHDALPQAWERKDIALVGVVASLPQSHERGQRFEFDVERILTPGAIVPTHISLTDYGSGYASPDAKPGNDARIMESPPSRFQAGERWQLTVRLKRPHGTSNPHNVDFEAWAFERDIRATGYLRAAGDSRKLDALAYRPGYVVDRLRGHIRQHLDAVLAGAPYAAILRALAIGDDDGIDPAQWQVFLNTGTNHLMSISGLHITMLSGLMFALVMALWRRSTHLVLWLPARKAATFAAVCAALAYALVAGFSVPTQRTLYMLTIFALALWSDREVRVGRVLALALLTVTLVDPWAVVASGFWLSFGAVAIIAYVFAGRVGRMHWLREAIISQWAVTLGLLPLLLFMFQQMSVISPVANAFAIPVVSLAVVPLTLLGSLFPIEWPLQLAHAVMALCMTALEGLAGWSASTWQQQAPSALAMLLAVLGVLWILLPRGFPMRWLGWIALLPLLLPAPEIIQPGEMRVTVIDVGQGLSVLVRTAGHRLLYDAGPKFSAHSDSGLKTIFPYLRGEGIHRLDGFVISHDDADHSGGASSLRQLLAVGWISSSLPAHSPVLAGVRHIRCRAGKSWRWDGVGFAMLGPDVTSAMGAKDNNRSCVLRVKSAYGSLLLPGDIEREAEAALLTHVPDKLAAEVLVVPHHGSKTSSTPAFIEAVQPRAAIFTTGYLNRFGHPKPAVAERYRTSGIHTYRSDRDGAILLDFAVDGIHIAPWRAMHKRYWQDMAADCAECLAEKGLAR